MKEQLAHRLAGGELGGRGLGTKNYFLAQAQIAIDYFCEGIEKVENPYRSNGSGFNLNTHRGEGFEVFRKKILALLKGK